MRASGTSPSAGRASAPSALHDTPLPSRARRTYSAGALARRRWLVRGLKLLLPLCALGLLSAIVLWPEFTSVEDSARLAFRRVTRAVPDAVRIINPRYQGVDEQNRPFNVTAASAAQQGDANIIDLDAPRADIFLSNGAWVLLESRSGRYDKLHNELDLHGDVTVWHENGMTLRTEDARVDIKAGDAESDTPTAAQGSFGTINGDGFRLRDRGAVVIFTGNARAVLEGTR